MTRAELMSHFRVAVIGAGFAGIGMAIRLKLEGHHDFVVLDRGDDVGGTWRSNTYPGSACDVPSNLYCFAAAPNPDWSQGFCQQDEIQGYLRRCVRRFGIGPHLRLSTEVLDAGWLREERRWLVRTSSETITADLLVPATGPLSEPAVPRIPGLERFEGRTFHSACWDHELDLTGRRVAVIGTGASAAQFVPEIQPSVAELHVFQRTPPWVVPRFDRRRTKAERRAFRALPVLQRLARCAVYWGRESLMVALAGPGPLLKLAEWLARLHLRRQVSDVRLRSLLTPRYAIGCKRLVVSNSFYPALLASNVELVVDEICEVLPHAIQTADGTCRRVDTVIFGTGFKPAHNSLAARIRGRDGRSLAAQWQDGAQAYLGMTVAGFPNMFMLGGPNSVLGHNSVILAMEAQSTYVTDALEFLDKSGFASADVRPETQRAFVDGVHERMKRTVWMSGCASWYLDEQGRNTTLWPGFTRRFRRLTRRFDPDAYVLETGARSGGRETPRSKARVRR